MPTFGGGDTLLEETNRAVGAIDRNTAAQINQGTRPGNYGLASTIAGSAAFGVVDLVDTVQSSIPGLSSLTGLKRGDINQNTINASQALGVPGIAKFYREQQQGIEIASAVYGVVGSELLTRGIFRVAAPLARTAQAIPFAGRIATLGKQQDAAVAAVRSIDTALASRAALGAEQMAGRAIVDYQRFDRALGGMVRATGPLERNKAYAKALRLGAARGTRDVLATEATMAILLNQNGFLYEESAAHNIAWMALGAGLGAGVELAATAYQIRKAANSDEVRRAFADSLDPSGREQRRLLSEMTGDSAFDETGVFSGGRFTDEITSLMLDQQQLNRTAGGGAIADPVERRGLFESRKALATQHERRAVEALQKVTTSGVFGRGDSRFTVDLAGFGDHAKHTIRKDPAAFYGVEELGGLADDVNVLHVNAERADHIKMTRKALQAKLKGKKTTKEEAAAARSALLQLEFKEKLTPTVYIDGEALPMDEAAPFLGFKEPEIAVDVIESGTKTGRPVPAVKQTKLFSAPISAGKGKMTLDTNLVLHLPGKTTLQNLSTADSISMYRVANKTIDAIVAKATPVTLPKNPTWMQLDMAAEVTRRSGGETKIVYPEGMTPDSAMVESLAQKAEELRDTMKKLHPEQTPEELAKLRVKYNLPRLTAYERAVLDDGYHPVERLLKGIAEGDVGKIREMSSAQIKDVVAQFRSIGDFAPAGVRDVDSLAGNSFTYMMDSKGKGLKPMLGYRRPMDKFDWGAGAVEDSLAARKNYRTVKLIAAGENTLTGALSRMFTSSSDYHLANRPNELMQQQIAGIASHGNSDNAVQGLFDALMTTEMRDRDNPLMLAVSRLRDQTNRITRNAMQKAIKETLGNALDLLKSPANMQSNVLLNQFHSLRTGWDLTGKTIARTVDSAQLRRGTLVDAGEATAREGKRVHAFELAVTDANKRRWRELTGTELAKGQTLQNHRGVEVVLDDLALDVQTRYDKTSDILRGEKNALLAAVQGTAIRKQAFYTPPPTTDDAYIGFVLGPDKKPVKDMAIVAKTEAEFNRARQALQPRLEQKGLGYTFVTQDQIKAFADVWDRADMDMLSPAITAIQPGKKATGGLSSGETNMQAFENSLKYLQDGFLQHGNDVFKTFLKEAIDSTKARANIARPLTPNSGKGRESRSIYDAWLENALGKQKIDANATPVAQLFNAGEKVADGLLSGSQPTWNKVSGWLNKPAVAWRGEQGRKEFESLSRELGDYMPFGNTAELLEARFGATPPWTAKAFVGNMHQFTAGALLRFGEVAHGIMNLTGIVNAMPAVVRNMQPRAGESVEDFAARVGHNAMIFDLPDGTKIGTLDMTKVGARAFSKAWSRERHVDYDYMVQHGYLSQEVAEFHRQFGAIEGKAEWKKYFLGDETIKNPKGATEVIKQKGIVGWMSTLSDNSEDFSRSWGHMVGLEMAETLGIKKMADKHTFAHDIANKMIANYNPANRPEVFQGAIGGTLGLFQSFVMNYYQRLFRYAETKDGVAFAQQYATQAGIFGVTTLPGWEQFNSTMMTASTGEDDPSSGIIRAFGAGAGDVIANGVLSSIPRLFGADAVDLYSRGDTNVRLPGAQGVPAYTVATKIMGGIAEGIMQFKRSYSGLTDQEVAEIVSNAMPNRPIAGIIEQFAAGGNDTDSYGQLVQDTQTNMEMVYRIMGLRSQRQSQQLQQFFTNKSAQEHKAALDHSLRVSTRAAIRDGSFPEQADEIFVRYVENGGKPAGWRRWIRGQVKSATSTSAQRQLNQTLNNPALWDQSQRLLDAGVTAPDWEANNPEDLYGPFDQEERLVDGDLLLTPDGPVDLPRTPQDEGEQDGLGSNDSLGR